MNILLEQFSTFTKEDWIKFDELKGKAFEPTLEEIEIQRIKQEQARIELIKIKLSNLWITRPEIITKEYVIWLLTSLNAQQFIWADFDKWVDNQISLFGDLETAFDDLVLRFL